MNNKKKDYYKPKRVSNFWNNNYIEYESNGDKTRNLSLDKYPNKIKPYLRNIIIDLQSSDTWKIQLAVAINFILSKDANEVPNELFESLRSRYQGNLETSMRGSDFIFDSVQLKYCKCHKTNFERGCSYIDSPDWIKKKRATTNLKNTDSKWFQYAVTVALNYEEIKWNTERVSNIKPFINKDKEIN